MVKKVLSPKRILFITVISAMVVAQINTDTIIYIRDFGNGDKTSHAYTADFTQILIGTNDGKVRLHDRLTGNAVLTYPDTWMYPMIVRSPSGNLVAIYSYDIGTIISIFHMKTGALIKEMAHSCGNIDLSFSSDDSIILAANVWGPGKRFFVYKDSSLDVPNSFARCCYPKISMDGTKSISIPQNSTDSLFCYDFNSSGSWVKKYPSFAGVDFFQDSLIILKPNYQKGLLILQTVNGDSLRRIAKAFTIDYYEKAAQLLDNRIVFSSNDTICVWNTKTDTLITRLKGVSKDQRALGFTIAGTQIIVENRLTKKSTCWSAASGDSIGEFAPFTFLHFDQACINPQLSADGTKILSEVSLNNGKKANMVPRLWDAATGKLLRTYWDAHSMTQPRLSRDGLCIMTASDMDTIVLWDVQTGDSIRTFHSGLTGITTDNTWAYQLSTAFARNDSMLFCTFSIDSFNQTTTARYSTRAIWWDRFKGVAVKQGPLIKNGQRFPKMYTSTDCSLYLQVYPNNTTQYSESCTLYKTTNDTVIGSSKIAGQLIAVSGDLSTLLYKSGYKWDFTSESSVRCFDSSGISCQGACFSNDKSCVLFSYCNTPATAWSTALMMNNVQYDISSNYLNNNSLITGYDFSADGKKTVVNFTIGQPCLYDVYKVTGILKPADPQSKPPEITVLAIDHRKLRINVRDKSFSSDAKAELRIYSTNGRMLARYPLYSGNGMVHILTLPSALGNGMYLFRFVYNDGERKNGIFTMIR